jgi:hypothetical protein
MKLFVRMCEDGYEHAWDNVKDRFDEEGNKIPYESDIYRKEDGWYSLDREPDYKEREYLEYDPVEDRVIIRKRILTEENIEKRRQALIKQQIKDELPELILQNKDNPAQLAQALCGRAKQLEEEHGIERI